MKKCTTFEEQKGTRYIRGNVSFAIIVFTIVFHVSFSLFWLGDKRFLSEFFGKWAWFHGFNERFIKYIGWKLKFQKTETGFADERALIATTLMSSYHWKTFVPFCLRKKRPEKLIFNVNSELSQIRTKNKLCHLKQH